jgi:hypothetical protein
MSFLAGVYRYVKVEDTEAGVNIYNESHPGKQVIILMLWFILVISVTDIEMDFKQWYVMVV